MIEKLKALEAAATPRPWEGVKHLDDVHTTTMYLSKEDTYLADTLRNLAPELIALWEAQLAWKECDPDGPCKERLEAIDAALDALNAKAAEVLK